MDALGCIRKPTHGVSVVFIHGILSSSAAAWKAPKAPSWPQLLEADKDLEDVGIYTFDYPSDRESANYGIFDAAELLKDVLERGEVLKNRRIVLVCHSMGGLVARKFLVKNESLLAERRIEIGLFLVASPSLGSRVANIGLIRLLVSAFGNKQAEALRFSSENLWLQELDRSFMDLKDSGRLPIAGKELFEDRALPWLFGQIVEPFSAARYFADAVRIPLSDHSTICKPENRDAPQHQYLRDFIRNYRYTSARSRVRKVALRIFLASESPETVSEMLATCKNVLNSVLRQPSVEIPYDLKIETEREYGKAFGKFDSNLDDYDIVMLDDLWLPRFEPRLADLSTLESFQDCFSRDPFDSVFLESLTGVCKRPGSGAVFAVPLSGNVQLLMYRKDLLNELTGGQKLPRDPDQLLALVKQATKVRSEIPFIVRYETDNDLTENFWELLRAYGYDETYAQDGEILIPSTLAEKALRWITEAHPEGWKEQLGWEDVLRLMPTLTLQDQKRPQQTPVEQKRGALMMFGWPIWIMPDLIRKPDLCNSLMMQQFIDHPITGFWSFAIPKASRFQEEAMKLIGALATVPELQGMMADVGLIPVVKETLEAPLKRRHPAWFSYFQITRDALAAGRPRPRSARWRDIEREIARRIRAGRFTDEPGLFRFVERFEDARKAAVQSG